MAGRPRGFDTEKAVADAALVFWRNGYEGTGIRDLTEATGLSTQSIYAAFGSKQDLYRRCLDWYEREVVADVAGPFGENPDVGAATADLLTTLAQDFTGSGHPAGCMRSTALLRCAAEHSELAAHASALRRRTAAGLAATLGQDRGGNGLRAGIDPEVAGEFLNAVIVGMSVAAQDGASADQLRRVAELAASALREESPNP